MTYECVQLICNTVMQLGLLACGTHLVSAWFGLRAFKRFADIK